METPTFDRMHKVILSHLWALGVDFWLLVVIFRYLPVNSGTLRVDLKPPQIDFWPLEVDFGLCKAAFVCDSILGIWELSFFFHLRPLGTDFGPLESNLGHSK